MSGAINMGGNNITNIGSISGSVKTSAVDTLVTSTAVSSVDSDIVVFNGTTIHPSGAEWSVHGAMDRITGLLGATVIWFNRRTNDLLMTMNYELICNPTN